MRMNLNNEECSKKKFRPKCRMSTSRIATVETTKHKTTTGSEKRKEEGSGVKSAPDRQESARTYDRSPRRQAPNVGPFWSMKDYERKSQFVTLLRMLLSKYSVTTNEEKGSLSLYRLFDFLNQHPFIDI